MEDAADGIIAAALNADTDVLNLGSGVARSIGEVAERIKAVTGYEGRIVFRTDRFVGVKRRVLDVRKMRDTLGWTATTSLDDGLTRSVHWYASRIARDAASAQS